MLRDGREGSAGATVVGTCFRKNEAEYLARARIHIKRVSGCSICLSQNQTKARPQGVTVAVRVLIGLTAASWLAGVCVPRGDRVVAVFSPLETGAASRLSSASPLLDLPTARSYNYRR